MRLKQYIETLKIKIIEEKLNKNRFDVIRNYQKELDMVFNTDVTDVRFKNKTQNNITKSNTVSQANRQKTIYQLELYLYGLKSINRKTKDKLVEVKHQKNNKVRFICLEERLSIDELNSLDSEIEFITNQINNLKG
jgi:hypothetical protein